MFEAATSDRHRAPLALTLALLMASSAFAGCITPDDGDSTSLNQEGSSTVLPLAQRWAEAYDGADVSVSGGGSSHGINVLLTGGAEMGDASRTIGPGDYRDVDCDVTGQEIQQAQDGDHPWQYPECNGVTPTEWVVAYDALSVVVHPSNDWIGDGLTYEQLRAIFTTENTAQTWDEVPGLEDAPNEEIKIYAPDEASGTYEFFFEEIANGTEESLLAEGSDRYSPSSDDNVILNAIANNEHAIGFFGLSYYLENQDSVDAVPIQGDEASEPVAPGSDTASEYPITRPLHVYTDGIPSANGTATEEAVHDYLSFVLSEEGQSIVPNAGYVKVSAFAPEVLEAERNALN